MAKTVLNILDVDNIKEDLATAIGYCQAQEAHLVALVAALAPPPPIDEFAAIATEGWLQQRENDSATLAAKLAEVEAAIGKSGISGEAAQIYAEMAWLSSDIRRRALYSDFCLAGPGTLANEALRTCVMDGCLFEARKPVLMCRKGQDMSQKPECVMVAWDSKVEASQSVHHALDILKAANNVHVVLVDPQVSGEKNGEEPGSDIATYLARHGANVTVDRLPSGGRSVAEVLTQHASGIQADLMVMGAYSHSRLRELVFGGTTRSLTETRPMSLFLAR